MWLPRRIAQLAAVAGLLAASVTNAAEFPANFPGDVPIADYMQLITVSDFGEKGAMYNIHAPGKTITDVADWFSTGLAAAGWKVEGEQVSARNAILAYKKNGRKCGISITNFVMDASMQMDETIKGITLQLSGTDVAAAGKAETATEAATTMDAAE